MTDKEKTAIQAILMDIAAEVANINEEVYNPNGMLKGTAVSEWFAEISGDIHAI